MNENLLSPCRACGKMISKNLVSTDIHSGSYHQATIRSGSCPNCGEAEPHLTREDIRRIRKRKTFDERNTKKLHEDQRYELEKANKSHFNEFFTPMDAIVLCGACLLVLLVLIFGWIIVFGE